MTEKMRAGDTPSDRAELERRIAGLEDKVRAKERTIRALIERAEGPLSGSFELTDESELSNAYGGDHLVERPDQQFELQEALEELRRTQAKLLQAQKLEAIGQLAAGIAHEINTPTQYVSNNTAFLQKAFENLAQALEATTEVLEAAKRGPVADELVVRASAAVGRAKIAYLFYQAFQEGGFASLEVVLRVLENLLGPSYTALAPERRREEHVDRRLAWLFDKIQRAIEYHEKFGTEEWAALTKTLVPAEIENALGAAKRLSEQLVARDALRADRALAQLGAKLRSYEESPRSHLGLTPPLASAPAAEQKSQPSTSAEAQPTVTAVREGLYRMEIVVAYAFVDLCRKLKAFEAVIQKHQFQKAAVLAVEIDQIADAFDPRLYFPELFSAHAALHSKHAATLAREASEQDTPIWRALARYARVDLDGFVES